MLKQYIKHISPYVHAKVSSVDTSTWTSALGVFALAVLTLIPELTHAQAIADTVCIIVDQLAGPVGRAIAAVAVIFLGFSLFMGKVTWGLALALGIGIAAIFGAEEIVDLLAGDETGQGCDSTTGTD